MYSTASSGFVHSDLTRKHPTSSSNFRAILQFFRTSPCTAPTSEGSLSKAKPTEHKMLSQSSD